jgi:hypothetical protein
MAVNDLIELSTTVTAQSGATVTLASVEGLAVGDGIIIESDHGYNELGLDGEWEITGKPDHYYGNAIIGKSFIGTVQGISGSVVTVDRTVPTGAVGLNCYRNNFAAVQHAVNQKLAWPSRKVFAVASANSSPPRCELTDSYYEFDFNNCEIFAPRGTGALALYVSRVGGGPVSNKRYANLTLRGNARISGYGVSAETGKWRQGSSQPAAFTVGGVNSSRARNVYIENFTFIDNWRSLAIDVAEDCIAYNCRSEFTSPLYNYVQWEYQFSTAFRCAVINCPVISNWFRPAYNAFKSQGVSFLECQTRNGLFAINTSGAVLVKNCGVLWTEENPYEHWSPNYPVMAINRTIENQQGYVQEGTVGGTLVKNFSVIYERLPYPTTSRMFNTINIDQGYYSVPTQAVIDGVSVVVPFLEATTPNTGYVVRSDDPQAIVSNVSATTLNSGTKVVIAA